MPAGNQPDVCELCHTSTDGYRRCYPCHEARRYDAPEVLPIAMSVRGELLHRHLRRYKDEDSSSVRLRMGGHLAALLAIFVTHHRSCIGRWDTVTCVPSPQRVAPSAFVKRVTALKSDYRQVLTAERDAQRTIDPGQFRVTQSVAGRHILLVDDTFTTGAKVFSATTALRDAGAQVAGPVVLGRHVELSWNPSVELIGWLRDRPWDERRCARCHGERRDPNSML